LGFFETQYLKPSIGFPRARLSRAPSGNAKLLLLDGYSAFANVDLDTGGLLPLLVELITDHRGDDGKNADDEVENVTIHGLVPFSSRKHSSDQPTLSSGRVPLHMWRPVEATVATTASGGHRRGPQLKPINSRQRQHPLKDRAHTDQHDEYF